MTQSAMTAAAEGNSLVGRTFWGPEARVHFFANSVQMEQIPRGKRRGITTSKMTLCFFTHRLTTPYPAADQLRGLAEAVATSPWKRLAGMLIAAHNAIMQADGSCELYVGRQKGVHAPDPADGNLPEPATNPHNTWIDMTGDSVSLRDNTDQNNLPSAFTQGPRARQAALKVRAQWEGLRFGEILRVWREAGIRYHQYCAMD